MFFFSTRFERDYTRTKSKEVEDSQEIRRLKTEKMVLRHRVDALEDVRKLLKLMFTSVQGGNSVVSLLWLSTNSGRYLCTAIPMFPRALQTRQYLLEILPISIYLVNYNNRA